MTHRPSAADRRRDVAAVVILLAGAALYGYGFLGLHALATKPIVLPRGEFALARFDHFWYLSRAGATLILIGVAAVAWSFWRHRRRRHAHP